MFLLKITTKYNNNTRVYYIAMKQKRDEKGRFEKKEKKCEKENIQHDNATFALGIFFGMAGILLLFMIAVVCGIGATNEVKTITISDKLSRASDDHLTVFTCANDAFWVENDMIYLKLKVGHTYTVKTHKLLGWAKSEITEIITNNDPPAAECSG